MTAYIEDVVVVDGVKAIRRRSLPRTNRVNQPYLHISMQCVPILCRANISGPAWALALGVLRQWKLRGHPASVTSAFAASVGIDSRGSRRHAIDTLAASGLFEVIKRGKRATLVSVGPQLEAVLTAMAPTEP
jgi:hypothetical protein